MTCESLAVLRSKQLTGHSWKHCYSHGRDIESVSLGVHCEAFSDAFARCRWESCKDASSNKVTIGHLKLPIRGCLQNDVHFLSQGSFSHVKPHARGWNVDYFASVFVGNANVFDAEMQHVSFEKDPIFVKFEHLNQTNLSFITSVISSTLTRSGAKVPYARAFDRHDTATEDLSFIYKSMMW